MDFIAGIKQAVINADIVVFRFINGALYNEYMAILMKFAANDFFLIVVVFTGFFFLAKKFGKKEKINIAFSLWAVIAANIINSKILKVIFKRQRPVAELVDVNFLVVMKKFGYAFPSTHSAMAAALVTVLWVDYKKLRPYLAGFALLVGFFCVYTGGHYPLDVLFGLLTGILIGMIFNLLKYKRKK